MPNTLGTRIAEYRRAKGITQDQLAEYMSVSSQAVSKWENDLSCPDISLLPRLADYFGITVDELLRGENSHAVRVVPEENRKDLSRMLIRISVKSSDGDIVKVNLPLGLVKAALEIGLQMPQISGNEALKDIDFNAVLLAAESGVIGKLVEVQTVDGDYVEIVIE